MKQPAKEPLKMTKQRGNGRPEYSDEQYQRWLDEMRPWLRAGNTLYYAMDKADLLGHQTTIYDKYRANDWFSVKVNVYRQTMGELANNITFKLLENINMKVIEGAKSLSREDFDLLKLVAEKHRTAQPFFVNRLETAESDPSQVGKILDTLEMQSDYGTLGQKIARQSVETDPPLQDKEQSGAVGDVPTEQDTTQTPA
jgi:hypothetical protein